MIKVNAIGDSCLIPVIKTKNAMKEMTGPDTIEVLVDNEIAVQNVTKMAQSSGGKVTSEKVAEKEYRILIAMGEACAAKDSEEVSCKGKQNQQRKDDHRTARHHKGPVGTVGSSFYEKLPQSLGYQAQVCIICNKGRPHIIVVTRNKAHQSKCDKGGFRHWHNNFPECLPMSCSIHLRRFYQPCRDLHKRLSEQKNPKNTDSA